MLVTWACLALAVLSKGIVALLLTGGTLVIYMISCATHPCCGACSSPWVCRCFC